MHANASVRTPLSPMERELTAEMRSDDSVSAATHDATTEAPAADFPRSTSSWELLDIVGNDAAAHAGPDAEHPLHHALTEARVQVEDAVKGGEGEETTALPPVAPLDFPSAADIASAATATAAADGSAILSGRVSPANTVSSAWSLVSTPSNGRFSGSRATAAVHPHTQLPFTPIPSNELPTAQLNNATHAEEDQEEESRGQRRPLQHRGMPSVSQTFSIASPPPSPVPPHIHAVASAGAGWSATSYEEVCMSEALRHSRQGSGVVSAGTSSCTAPSPMRMAEGATTAGTRAVSGRCPTALPRLAESQRMQHDDMANEEADGDDAPAAAPHSPTTAQLLSWLASVRPTLPEESTAAHGATRHSTTWTVRRISFLSSSSSTAAAALAVPLLSRASLPGFAEMPPPAPPQLPPVLATPALSPSPAVASPSLAVTLSDEVALWWSRTRVVCSDGSQQALRGLHRLCGYVWADLTDHWYPQLRLVLGDHSCATKSRRTSRRSLRRIASRPAGTTAGAWRSVSAPCLVSGEVRWGGRYELRRGTHEGRSSAPAATSSTATTMRGGLQTCFAMTADAVASAAQGLLVFLL